MVTVALLHGLSQRFKILFHFAVAVLNAQLKTETAPARGRPPKTDTVPVKRGHLATL